MRMFLVVARIRPLTLRQTWLASDFEGLRGRRKLKIGPEKLSGWLRAGKPMLMTKIDDARLMMKHCQACVASWLIAAVAFTITLCGASASQTHAQTPNFYNWAQTPPMGWNSWDVYGSSVIESEVRANAVYMRDNLKDVGWEYVVIDIRWYVDNPGHLPGDGGYRAFDDAIFNYNSNGIMLPSMNRFTSTTDGTFTQLASDIHDMGLKFGLHMMRGINREFYDNLANTGQLNRQIGNSGFTFSDLAVENNGAFWLNDNYGLQQNDAAQAWYNEMIGTYASWGLDYIKVDDLSAATYRAGEVEMLRNAIDNSGRPIILSTSPGPTADIDFNLSTPIDSGIAGHVQNNANMWRITNDLWDEWGDVYNMFERANQWTDYRGDGHFPDNDMLPLGRIGIRAERGSDRMSNLTQDEQRTMMSLWSVTRSPLMFGGDLPSNDAFTLSLLNNPEVIAVNQHSSNNRQLFRDDDKVAWVADAPDGGKYLAVFNLSGEFETLLSEASYVSDLITDSTIGNSTPINVDITGKDRLFLLVDWGDGPGPDPDVFDFDWADWVNMELQGPNGNLSLTDLDWISATSGFGVPNDEGFNIDGGPLSIDGVTYTDGIGTHARSIIEYELPEGYTLLTGLAGLDDGGVNQNFSTSSVRFAVTALKGDGGLGAPRSIDVLLEELGLSGDVLVRDLWSRTDLGTFAGSFSTDLLPHASGLYLLTQPTGVPEPNFSGIMLVVLAGTMLRRRRMRQSRE